MSFSFGSAERAARAQIHTDDMEKFYGDMIEESSKNTVLYDQKLGFDVPKGTGELMPKFSLMPNDTVTTLLVTPYKEGKKVCVLNFASFVHPGGGFIRGAMAQEEALCHESFLYNVLERQSKFYSYNNAHRNKDLYLNRALYSPDVIFIRDEHGRADDEVEKADVLTCAAPFWDRADANGISREENDKYFRSRIAFVRDVVVANHVDIFIAGAFGCGVFGQDPALCAVSFKAAFVNTPVEQVIFAVPPKPARNYKAFKAVIE